MRNLSVFLACLAAVLALAAAPAAVGATVELGYFSFDNLVPAASGATGVNGFSVVNLTGANNLPPEATATSPLVFLNASITYTQSGAAPVTIQLGDLGPGAASLPLTLSLPSTATLISAQFNATLSATVATLAGMAQPQNLSTTAISASLLPATAGATIGILVEATPPNQITFLQQPANAIAGVALAPAVAIQLAAGATGSVTLTSTPAGLSATAAAVNGIATFNNLILSLAGTYTLTATASGYTAATTNSFTIAPAGPAKLSFLQQAPNGTAGLALASPVAVQIQDAFGNPTNSAASVTLTSYPAGASATLNAVNGIATFNNLVLTTARNYSFTATSAGLANGNGASFSIAAAAASKLAFLQQPPNGGLGVALTPAASVQILDSFGNLTGSNAAVTVASNPAGVTATATAINGLATFGNLIFTAPNTYTLNASASGLTGAVSTSFTAGSGVLTLVTDKPAYAIGQLASLSGTFLTAGGAPIANASVVLNLTLNGVTRTLSAVTGSGGAYAAIFQPGPSDAGAFQVSATGAGGGVVNTAAASFRVVGLQLSATSPAVSMVMGTSSAPALTLLNSGDAALNALNVTLSSNAPASVTGNLNLAGVPVSLAKGATVPFSLAVNTSAAPPPGSPVVFTITATAIDAASGAAISQTTTVTVTAHPATSSANLSPLSAVIGVNPGGSVTQQYTVRNDGYVAIPNAAVTLTQGSATPWLTLGNPNLGQIEPGQSKTFQIIANPPAGLTAQTFSVPFTVTGASSTVQAALTLNVNPPGSSTGTATFSVANDLGQYVPAATVTLISKTNASLTYQGATDANGNVTVQGVPAGDYNYVAAAAQHEPGTGSVHVSAGGAAQALARSGPTLKAAAALPAATPIPVLLTYDVVTLAFSVMQTSITDVYVTELRVLYSTFLVKPVLQVIPTRLDYSFYPQANYPPYPQCFTLKIANLHPTSQVRGVTIDASQLDLATPAGARFHVYLFGPNSKPTDQVSTLNIGDLGGQHLGGSPNAPPVTACGTVNPADLISRDLGAIAVSGQYDYSDPGGIARVGTTSTPVPVSYTFPTDIVAPPIHLIHDETLGANDLRPLDANYPVYNVTSGRAVTAAFLNPQNGVFGGENLPAFAQTVTTAPQVPATKSDLADILANTPFWRANFFDPNSAGKPRKTGFNGVIGDTAAYDISGTDFAQTDLVSYLKSQLSTANRGLILNAPLYLGLGAQWADRPVGSVIGGPDGYKIPIEILGVTAGGIGSIGGSARPLAGSCPPVNVPGTYQPIECGQILIAIDVTQKFERQAFNVSLGVGTTLPLSNVTAGLIVKDASNQDASGQFTLVVASDPQGATTGGTLTTGETLHWQLIPKAGAGGVSGAQYSVSATFAYTVGGQAHTTTTQTVTITVMPQPQLLITYAVPFLAVQNKTEKIRISVQNTGGGIAHNFSASAAQPRILANPGNADDPASFNWKFAITGSSGTAAGALQAGVNSIGFGDILPGQTVSGYYGLVVSNCNYSTPALHTDCGFILDSTATLKQQDYLGIALDPLVGTPIVQFVPAVGGKIVDASQAGVAGLLVTVSRSGMTLGMDTSDADGGYFIGDLTPGPLTISVATADGTVLSTRSNVTVLADSSTNFIDFVVQVPAATPVAITVGTSPAGPSFVVDGVTYSSGQTLSWIPGSTHTLSATATQAATTGKQYVFRAWSNGGGLAQTVTAPTAPTSYLAAFTTQYLLTTGVSPAAGGSVTPLTGYIDAGTVATLTASPANGYQFASFSGGLTGALSPATVTMNGPMTVTANFSPIAPLLTASITARSGTAAARAWTITLSNAGAGVGLATQINSLTVVPVGSPGCTVAPKITQPAAGPSPAAPLAIGDIGPLGSASGQVVLDFSGCQTTTKFNITVGYTANSGAYKGSATFNNQFR